MLYSRQVDVKQSSWPPPTSASQNNTDGVSLTVPTSSAATLIRDGRCARCLYVTNMHSLCKTRLMDRWAGGGYGKANARFYRLQFHLQFTLSFHSDWSEFQSVTILIYIYFLVWLEHSTFICKTTCLCTHHGNQSPKYKSKWKRGHDNNDFIMSIYVGLPDKAECYREVGRF